MSKGILYVMSGPSGTGKGTVCAELIEKRDIHLSVSTTSRNQRTGEIAGVTYNYTSAEKFREMVDNEELLEWAVYNGNYYGTPKAQIMQMLEDGKDVLLEIEPQGALKVKAEFPETVLIFIIPPSMEILRQRLVDRLYIVDHPALDFAVRHSVKVFQRQPVQFLRHAFTKSVYDLLRYNRHDPCLNRSEEPAQQIESQKNENYHKQRVVIYACAHDTYYYNVRRHSENSR